MSEHHGDRIHAAFGGGGPGTSRAGERGSDKTLDDSFSASRGSDDGPDPAATSQVEAMETSSADANSSPAPSVASSQSSSRLRDAVLDAARRLSTQIDLGSATRPTVQRDLSHASAVSTESTESSVTITPFSPRLGRQSISVTPSAYPNQALSALHYQKYPPVHVPATQPPTFDPKSRSSWSPTSPRIGLSHVSGVRTWGNSPAVTPGLYQPSPSRSAGTTPTQETAYQSPYLHHLHHQIPKETHVADIDVDPISGRKIINNYEILDELGRGTHGKVKLGRSLTDGRHVAIKIVERFPKKRRLGRLGNAEDKVKREVAILKKARHPHVVALLEVIDDPARRKVYIILERVDLGEIPWRTRGSREIAVIECRRYEREARRIPLTAGDVQDDDAVLNLGRVRRAKAARAKFKAARQLHQDEDHMGGGWSLELNGDLDDESELDTASHQSSSVGDISAEELDRIVSKPPDRAPFDVPDTLETVRPVTPATTQPSPDTSTEDSLASALDGTWYGAAAEPIPESISEDERQLNYHQTDMEPLETVLTREDAALDVNQMYRDLSHDDLANRAASILDSDVQPDLLYVPCMTFQAARETFRDTLLGLQYLHYQGIIHRDIKPPNLLQTRDHRTKISDFGVSYLGRPIEEEGDESSDADVSVDEAKELAKNVGTPAFYAPELCFTGTSGDNAPIGKGIDIWALGVTLFCMIFARVPFVDTEFIVMRRIADEEVYIPGKRLRPVDTRPQSRDDANILHYTGNPTYRGAHALEYEDLDDLLLDLLRRLLTKDVKKRATLDEVRHHPWVMDDLPDKMAWLDMSAPSNNAEGKKIEISREDLESSVVPISIIDRIRSGIKKAVGLGRSSSARRRNPSQDTSNPSSASSSAANVHGRRSSLRNGEDSIISALKAIRDPDHLLAYSAFASPTVTPGPKSRVESAAQTPNAKSGTPKTLLSSTNSSKTVRAIDAVYEEGYFGGSVPSSPLIATNLDSPGSSNFSGLLSGARGLLRSVRDRSSTGRSDDKRLFVSDHSSEVIDQHADPSIALSTASATGHTGMPRLYRGSPSVSSRSASPAMSRNSSIVSTSDLAMRHTGSEDSRSVTARDSPTTGPRSPATTHSVSLVSRGGQHPGRDYDHAENEMLRRQLAEELARPLASPALPPTNQPGHCPPSPDDDPPPQGRRTTASPAISTDSAAPSKVPSLETGLTSPTSSAVPVITPVSSADHLKYDMSSAISEPEHILGLPERLKEKAVLPPIIETVGSPQQSDFLRKAISDDEAYHADAAVDSDEYDDSSDDDGGLTMMRRKSIPQRSSRSISVSNAVLARNRERRATGGSTTSKKSSRSGSIKTGRRTHDRPDSIPDEQRGRKLSA